MLYGLVMSRGRLGDRRCIKKVVHHRDDCRHALHPRISVMCVVSGNMANLEAERGRSATGPGGGSARLMPRFHASSASWGVGQLMLLPYIPERSKQHGRRLPLASMSQAVLIRRARVSACLAETIQ